MKEKVRAAIKRMKTELTLKSVLSWIIIGVVSSSLCFLLVLAFDRGSCVEAKIFSYLMGAASVIMLDIITEFVEGLGKKIQKKRHEKNDESEYHAHKKYLPSPNNRSPGRRDQ